MDFFQIELDCNYIDRLIIRIRMKLYLKFEFFIDSFNVDFECIKHIQLFKAIIKVELKLTCVNQ